MKAEPEKIIDTMFDNKRQYQIPVYQRNYDWKKDNCLELFNDVINAYEKERTHFLGTVVQVQQDEEGGLKHYIIVDGQQRMTSIYLLLKALYDKGEESEKAEIKGLLFNESASHDFDKQEKNKLKLKPIKTDNEQFLFLMNDKQDKMDRNSNIWINYDYFCTLIDEKKKKEYKIKNILNGLKRLEIVMISLKEPNDDPQVIFERINSTGEDLKLADLIRNYLLMTDVNMDYLFEEYWLPVETKLGKTEINKYFLTYIIFKLGEVKEDEAYQQFKKWADASELSHEDIMKELKYYSKFYAAFAGFDNDYSKEINNYLAAYRSLKQSTMYPFLFSVFDDYERKVIDEEIVLQILQFYLNYTIRRLVVGIPSNSLRGLYRSLYKRIFKNESLKDNYLETVYTFMAVDLAYTKDATPSDTTFKEKLMSENIYKNRSLCKYLLSILENGVNAIKEIVQIDSDTTIEHIMPQNKDNEDWRKEIGENFDIVYDRYLHTLGNLSLTGYNSELSDKKFKEKVDMIKAKSKFVVLNQDVIDKQNWNEKTITARADRLSSKLLQDLKLPEVFGKKIAIDKENSHHVDDVYDYTGKKPTNFIFMGENKEVASAREMLMKFIELLNSLDSEKLQGLAVVDWKSASASTPLLSSDPDKLRGPKELLNTGIYVETNRSFNDIVRSIGHLLREFELESDDFIFYTSVDANETSGKTDKIKLIRSTLKVLADEGTIIYDPESMPKSDTWIKFKLQSLEDVLGYTGNPTSWDNGKFVSQYYCEFNVTGSKVYITIKAFKDNKEIIEKLKSKAEVLEAEDVDFNTWWHIKSYKVNFGNIDNAEDKATELKNQLLEIKNKIDKFASKLKLVI